MGGGTRGAAAARPLLSIVDCACGPAGEASSGVLPNVS